MNNIPSLKGLEYVGVPALNNGAANFIQLYINDNNSIKPFMRVGARGHYQLLEEFLKEADIDKTQCELVGGGIISEALSRFSYPKRLIKDPFYPSQYNHVDARVYAVFGQCGPYQKYPDMNHIANFKSLFDKHVFLYDTYNDYGIRLLNSCSDYESKITPVDSGQLKLSEYTSVDDGLDSDAASIDDDSGA